MNKKREIQVKPKVGIKPPVILTPGCEKREVIYFKGAPIVIHPGNCPCGL